MIGGIEFYIHRLAKSLQERGHQVSICLPVFTHEDSLDYCYDGIRVLGFKSSYHRDKLSLSGIFPGNSVEQFKQLLVREKPDIIHFHQFTNNNGISLHHIIAARAYGAKIVFTNHLSEFICQRGDFRFMGSVLCDGKIDQKKCTACILQKNGFNRPLSYTAAFLDHIAVNFVGKNNFKSQLIPFVFPGFHTRWHWHKISRIISLSDRFVSIADWFSNLLKQNGLFAAHCTTIHTGIPVPQITGKHLRQMYTGEGPLKIIYAGRIVPVKGLDILIRAVRAVSSTSVSLSVYGPDQQEAGGDKNYGEFCRELAAGCSNIRFYGKAANEELLKALLEHDVVCMPSLGNEMSPLLIQEAFSARVPVIGSSLPGIEEWITHGVTGFIFQTGDANHLQKCIEELIAFPGKLQQVTQHLPAPASYDEMVDQYESVYRQLYNKREEITAA